MNSTTDFAVPPGLGALEQSIKGDFSGDATRALIDRLAAAARHAPAAAKSAALQLSDPTDDTQRGYEAAQRIVRQIWQQQHGSVLTA